jgi:broad specificity phosphatase PhoE
MSTIIYIRHGKDKKRDKYKYDPKLTDIGKEQTIELTKRLVKKYGYPDIICFSPFSRTRQTVKYMLRTIERLGGREPRLKLDRRLSRFFTRREKRNPDVSRKTIKYGAPIYETWDDFKDRVREQLNDMERRREDVIWCVGHTLIIKRVAKYKGIDRDDYVKYSDTVIINNNDNNISDSDSY